MANELAAMNRVWIAAAAAAAAVSAGALLLQCWSIFWLQETVWDNEKLLLFDHLNRFAAGDGLNHLQLARIPSLIPDYLLGWIISWFSDDIRLQYFFYVWTISSLQLLLGGLLLSSLLSVDLARAVLVVSGLQILLLGISFPLAINLQISRLPINHGGNALLWFLFLILLLKALASPLDQVRQGWVLGCLAFAACLSNRIFASQAILPALFLILSSHGRQHRCLGLPILCGAVLGLVSSKLFINSGCLPNFYFSHLHLVAHLKELLAIRWWPSLGWSGGAGYILIIQITCTIVLVFSSKFSTSFGSKNDPISSFGCFVAWVTVFTLLPYPWLLQSQGLLGESLRYLQPLLLITPVSLAVVIAKITAFCSARQKRFLWRVALVLMLLAFSRVGMGPLWPRIFMEWRHPLVEQIEELIPAGSSVLTAEEEEFLLSSRALKAGSNWRLHVSQIASNGHANSWDQDKGEFYDQSHQLRDYTSLILAPDRRFQALTWYGNPAQVYKLDSAGNMLWIYDQAGRQRIKKTLQLDLAGSFSILCE
ncbi:MAG: hypothetical protein EBU12_03770 [Microbacteriaceae bacterium]|nr:hypothetical protein [Microbacteriaceae bacterium]